MLSKKQEILGQALLNLGPKRSKDNVAFFKNDILSSLNEILREAEEYQFLSSLNKLD